MAEMGTSACSGSSEYLLQENQQSVAFGVPPQQLQPVVQVQPQQGINKNAITPHSYLALSICVAICCGILNPLTLVCTIPAAVLSAMVSDINFNIVHKFY